MKLLLAIALVVLLGSQLYSSAFEITTQKSISDTIPEVSKDYSTFNLCYHDLVIKGKVERGVVGIFEGRKYFYETWSVPGVRGNTFSYLILRSDTTIIADYDFCFQQPPEDPAMFSDMIICKIKNGNKGFTTDISLPFEKIPTIIQPLVIGLKGNQQFSGFNRSLKNPPQIYFNGGSLHIRYFVYNRNFNTEEASIIRREYRFNGSEFKFYRESFVKNKKVQKAILYGEQ